MNLQENIERIKSLMPITESTYLKRRVPPDAIQKAFNSGLEFTTNLLQSRSKMDKPYEWFSSMVVTSMLTDIFDYIENIDTPTYEQLYDFLLEKYKDEMMETYRILKIMLK